jgi:MFS family permease
MSRVSPPGSLVLLLLASMLGPMAGATIVPVLEAIREDLGVGGTAAGLIITTHGLAIAIASPIAGWTIDRWGVRRPLATGLIIFGVAGGAGIFVSSYPALIASRAVFGVGTALVFTGSTVALLTLYQGTARDRVMGWRTSFTSFGGLTFPLLAGALGTLLSWHAHSASTSSAYRSASGLSEASRTCAPRRGHRPTMATACSTYSGAALPSSASTPLCSRSWS